MKNYRQERGRLYREARQRTGLTQGELADLLGYTSPQFVSNWERGSCDPAFEKLPLLAQLLKIRPKVIIDSILAEATRQLLIAFGK